MAKLHLFAFSHDFGAGMQGYRGVFDTPEEALACLINTTEDWEDAELAVMGDDQQLHLAFELDTYPIRRRDIPSGYFYPRAAVYHFYPIGDGGS